MENFHRSLINLTVNIRANGHTCCEIRKTELFIIVTTAANFILDCKQVDPAGQSAILLDGVTDMALIGSKPMDKVYIGLICRAQPQHDPVGNSNLCQHNGTNRLSFN